METKLYTYLFAYLLLSTFFRFIVAMFSSLLSSKKVAESLIQSFVRYGSLLDIIHLLIGFVFLRQQIEVIIPDFLLAGINFNISWDYISLSYLSFSIIIIALINQFSTVYLARDPFYFKFFTLIYLLQLALIILILSRGSETIFIGWELMGLSSILLIAFYEYRASVLKNSLIILAIYKTSDLLLYGSLLYSASAGVHFYDTMVNPYCLLALLGACLIKSSVFPWYWLPKAVEGPTQSTAVFYGGLASHIPIYLLIRVWDQSFLSNHPILFSLIVCLILFSMVTTNLLSRITNDAKNAIAYSTISQLGIIYLEVLFGFTHLAMVHCMLHGLYRTMEFLRSPSILYEHQIIDRNYVQPSNFPFGPILVHMPASLKSWVYRLIYNDFYLARVLMNLVENFMGLFSSRINASVIKTYICCSAGLLVMTEVFSHLTVRGEISPSDQILLSLAYILNIFALLNKYRPLSFFSCLGASVFVSLIVLADKLYPVTIWLSSLGLTILILMILSMYHLHWKIKPGINFKGEMHRSNFLNFVMLITGLSIIGMPGLGIFYIWSRLEHALIGSHPNLILLVYVILTLNTIVFFRFYYVNYLGKYDPLNQIKAVQHH